MSALRTFIHSVLKVLVSEIKKGKEIKSVQIGKK